MFLKRMLSPSHSQLAVESLQANGQHAHDDHFVERTGFAEVRCRSSRGSSASSLQARIQSMLVADSVISILRVIFGALTARDPTRAKDSRRSSRISACLSFHRRWLRLPESFSDLAFGHAGRDRSGVMPPSYQVDRLLPAWLTLAFFGPGSGKTYFTHLGVRRAVREQRGRTALEPSSRVSELQVL